RNRAFRIPKFGGSAIPIDKNLLKLSKWYLFELIIPLTGHAVLEHGVRPFLSNRANRNHDSQSAVDRRNGDVDTTDHGNSFERPAVRSPYFCRPSTTE